MKKHWNDEDDQSVDLKKLNKFIEIEHRWNGKELREL